MTGFFVVAFFVFSSCFNLATAASDGGSGDFAAVCRSCKDGDEASCLSIVATTEQYSNYDCVKLQCEDTTEVCDLIEDNCLQETQELPAPVVSFRNAQTESLSAITGADLRRLADATNVSEVAAVTESTALTLRDCQTLLQLLAEGAPNIDTKVMSGTPARFAYDSAKQTCYLLVKDGESGEDVSEPPAKVTSGLEHCEGANSACRACQKDGQSDSCEELFSTDESKSNLDCRNLCKKGFCDVIDKAQCFKENSSFSKSTKVAYFSVIDTAEKYGIGKDDLEGLSLASGVDQIALITDTDLTYRDCQTILQLILQNYSEIEKKGAIESKPSNFVFDKDSRKCYLYGDAGAAIDEISQNVIVGEPYCTGANPICRACAGGNDEECELLYSTDSGKSNLECKQECSGGTCESVNPEDCFDTLTIKSSTKVSVFTLDTGKTEKRFGFKKASLEDLATVSGITAIANITSEKDLDVRDCQTLLQLVSGDANVNSMNGTPESLAFDDKNKECFLLGTGGSDAAEAKTPAQAIVGLSHCDGANAVCRKCKNENNANSCQLLFALEGSAVSNVDCEKGDCDTGHCDTVKEDCFEERTVASSEKVSVFTIPDVPTVVSEIKDGAMLKTGIEAIEKQRFKNWIDCQRLLQLVVKHKDEIVMEGDPQMFAFNSKAKTCYFLTAGGDNTTSLDTELQIGPSHCRGCEACKSDATCTPKGCLSDESRAGACFDCINHVADSCDQLVAILSQYNNDQCQVDDCKIRCDLPEKACDQTQTGLPENYTLVSFTVPMDKEIYRISKNELPTISSTTKIDFTGFNEELGRRDCQTLSQLLATETVDAGAMEGAPSSFAFDDEDHSCIFFSNKGSAISELDEDFDEAKLLTSGPTYCDGENAAVNTEEVCKDCSSNSSCSAIYAVVPDKTNKDCELACDTESCDLVDASCFSEAQDFPANSSVISFEFPTPEECFNLGRVELAALQTATGIDDLGEVRGKDGAALTARDCQTVLQLLLLNKDAVKDIVNVTPKTFVYDNHTDVKNPSCIFRGTGLLGEDEGSAISDLGDAAKSLVDQSLLRGKENCKGVAKNADVASTCSKCTSPSNIADACEKLFGVGSNSTKSNYDCASSCDVTFCDFEDEECFKSGDIPSDASFIALKTESKPRSVFEITAGSLPGLKAPTAINEFGDFKNDPLTDRDCQTVLQLLKIEEGNIPDGIVAGNPSGFAFDSEGGRCFITAEDGKTLAELDSSFTVDASKVTGGTQTCSGINDDSDFSGVCEKCGAGDVASCSGLFATDSGSFNSNCTGVTCELDTCDLAEKQCFTDGDFPDKSAVVFTMTSYTALFKIAEKDVGELGNITQIDTLAAAVTSMSPRDCQTLLQLVAINSKAIPAQIMKGNPSQFVYDSETKACVLLGEGGSDAASLSYEFKDGTFGPRNCKGANYFDDSSFASVCEACKDGKQSACMLLYSVDPEVTNTDCATGDCEMGGCDLADEGCFVESTDELPETFKAIPYKLSDNGNGSSEVFALKLKDLADLASAADIDDFSSITDKELTQRDCQTLLQLTIANFETLIEKKILAGGPNGFVFDSAGKACIITGDGGEDLDYPMTDGVTGPPNCEGLGGGIRLTSYAFNPEAPVILIAVMYLIATFV